MKKILGIFLLSISLASNTPLQCSDIHTTYACLSQTNDQEGSPLWFHLESVDDLSAIMGLVIRIITELPGVEIFITTTLIQTKEIINYLFPKLHVHLIAQDNLQTIASLYDHLQPAAIILVKHNIILSLALLSFLHKTPIFLLNASVSQTTERLLCMSPYLYQELFNTLTGIFCSHEEDRQAFEKLGIKQAHTTVSGPAHLYNIFARKNYFLKKLKIEPKTSTPVFDYPVILMHTYNKHRIKLYLNAYEELQKKIPNLKLIISTGSVTSWENELSTFIKNKNLNALLWNKNIDQYGKKGHFVTNLKNTFQTNNIFISCFGGPLFFLNDLVPIFVCDESAAAEENFLIFQAAIAKNAIVIGPCEKLAHAKPLKENHFLRVVDSKNELCATLLHLLLDKEFFINNRKASYGFAKKIATDVAIIFNPFFELLKQYLIEKRRLVQ